MVQHLLWVSLRKESVLVWAQKGVGEASTEAGFILTETLV